jgi:hypothetical protein
MGMTTALNVAGRSFRPGGREGNISSPQTSPLEGANYATHLLSRMSSLPVLAPFEPVEAKRLE